MERRGGIMAMQNITLRLDTSEDPIPNSEILLGRFPMGFVMMLLNPLVYFRKYKGAIKGSLYSEINNPKKLS